MWSAKRTPDIQAASIVDARSGIELSQSPPKTKKIQSCQSWTLDVACDTNPMRGRPNKVDAVTASPTWLRHLILLMILISTWFRMPQTGLVQDLRWKFYIVKQRLIGKAAPQSCSLVDRTAPFSPPKVLRIHQVENVEKVSSLCGKTSYRHRHRHVSLEAKPQLSPLQPTWDPPPLDRALDSNDSVLYPSSALFEKGVWMLKLFKRCLPLLLLGFLQETPCGLVTRNTYGKDSNIMIMLYWMYR